MKTPGAVASVARTPIRAYRCSDITHTILDNLRSDKQSLASCSLVCASWTFIARLHLFATVRLHGDRADEFRAFLLSPGAITIRNHIRSLHWKEADDDALDIGKLCSILSLLSRVNTLRLCFNRFHSRPTAFPYTRATACLASVERLSVRCRLRLNAQGNNVQPLMEFLTWFNLSHLDLDSVKEFPASLPVDPYRVSYVPVPSRPLQVRNLNFLNGDAVYSEAEIMARVLGSADNLRSVTYQLQTSKDVYALGRLLRRSGKGLTTLSLLCCPNPGRSPVFVTDWHKLYLPYCTNLTTISLPGFWSYPFYLSSFFDTLACDAEVLHTLILGVSKPLPLNIPWRELENVLLSLRESVIICVDLGAVADHVDRQVIKSRIEGQWVLLMKHRRLRFEVFEQSEG